MIAFKDDKPFCDLQCRVCGGWEMKVCLFSGIFHMKMLAAKCFAKGVLLDENEIVGLWKDNIVLDSRELNVTPPEYRDETVH